MIIPSISLNMLRRCVCLLIALLQSLLVSRLIKVTIMLRFTDKQPLRDSLLLPIIHFLVFIQTVLAFLRLLKVLLLFPWSNSYGLWHLHHIGIIPVWFFLKPELLLPVILSLLGYRFSLGNKLVRISHRFQWGVIISLSCNPSILGGSILLLLMSILLWLLLLVNVLIPHQSLLLHGCLLVEAMCNTHVITIIFLRMLWTSVVINSSKSTPIVVQTILRIVAVVV